MIVKWNGLAKLVCIYLKNTCVQHKIEWNKLGVIASWKNVMNNDLEWYYLSENIMIWTHGWHYKSLPCVWMSL
jgi:hypothetical protein